VERGVAKLFRGKVTPFGSAGLRFTQSAALSAIAIVGLKSLVEYIRLLTLCKEGGGLLRTVLPVADTVLRLLVAPQWQPCADLQRLLRTHALLCHVR